jgi:hypothetical protein
MRRTFLMIGALIAFTIVVAAMAPASLAGVAVERASRGVLSLADAQGSFWRGRGMLAAAPSFRLPLAWTIDPWPLLRGELRVRIVPPTAAASAPRAEIAARRDAVALREVDVALPMDAVASLAPRSGIRVGGDVRVVTQALDWTPATFTGDVRLDWQDAHFAIANEPAILLGTVRAALSAAGDRLAGPLTSEGGTFEVRGSLGVATNGAPNVSVTMTPREGDPAQTRNLVVSSSAAGNWNVEYRTGPQ